MYQRVLNKLTCLVAGAVLAITGAALAQGELQLTSSGECPGTITLTVTNATPGGRVGIAYGRDPGQTPVPTCPGVFVDINAARVAAVLTADSDGTAVLSGSVSEALCGNLFTQAVDVRTCRKSNVEIVGIETFVVANEMFGPGGGGNDGPQYCAYQLVSDCPELGLRALDTICVRCDNQNHQVRCRRSRSKRVHIVFSRNCNERVCNVLAIGLGGCADCPRNVPPERHFIYCE